MHFAAFPELDIIHIDGGFVLMNLVILFEYYYISPVVLPTGENNVHDNKCPHFVFDRRNSLEYEHIQ